MKLENIKNLIRLKSKNVRKVIANWIYPELATSNFTFTLKDSKNPYEYCVSGNLMFSKLGPLKDCDNSPYSRCEIIQNDEEGVRVIW